jgi:hypothetical protein
MQRIGGRQPPRGAWNRIMNNSPRKGLAMVLVVLLLCVLLLLLSWGCDLVLVLPAPCCGPLESGSLGDLSRRSYGVTCPELPIIGP